MKLIENRTKEIYHFELSTQIYRLGLSILNAKSYHALFREKKLLYLKVC